MFPEKIKSISMSLNVNSFEEKFKLYAALIFLTICLFVINGCTDGGDVSGVPENGPNGGVARSVSGYKMPVEISAVPPKDGSSESKKKGRTGRAATDSGTDYSKTTSKKYVEEQTLKQFDTVDNVLNALSQTNYLENIDKPAYASIVAFNDDQDGVTVKKLQTWVVKAEAMKEEDQDVLRLSCWVIQDGTVIKAQFKIYDPATESSDGSYSDYGEWTLNVKFDETGEENFFAVSCSSYNSGSLVKVHEKNSGYGEEPSYESKAVLFRTGTKGYGWVSYPDFDAYWGSDGDKTLTSYPTLTASYAYNDDYLALKTDDGIVYKNRNKIDEMTHNYGIFDYKTGVNINKLKSFGFPVTYQMQTDDGTTVTKHAYYGAMDGRHKLWGDSTITEGAVVTREDTASDQTAETYKVGKTFNGVLVKRTLVDADLNDVKGIPVELFINNDYNLIHGDAGWSYCDDLYWPVDGGDPVCNGNSLNFDTEIGLKSLIVESGDNKKHVVIEGWDNQSNINKFFVYRLLPAPDFYEADKITSSDGEERFVPKVPLTTVDTSLVQNLWVHMDGNIYVEFNGDSWIEKEVIAFDSRAWKPVFGTNDKEYILPENKEIYINLNGLNYIVKKTNGVTGVKLELQTVVNPLNAASLVPFGTVFLDEWNPINNSTYEFITDPANPYYMMLVFKTIGDNHRDYNGDPVQGVSIGAVAPSTWGIHSASAGTFNWEYSENGGPNSVTYLMDGYYYKLLDDPVLFNPVELTTNAGEKKTVSLQFDGWLGGLPDMYAELEKHNGLMTADISDKIINIPAGTKVKDQTTGIEYIIKPLETSQYLEVTTSMGANAPVLDDVMNLYDTEVPDFVEHNMGDIPENIEVLYSEGVAVK